jgi:thiamine biosynthesis protein ThiS
MNIHLNGKPATAADNCSVAALLDERGLHGIRIAVLVNGALIHRRDHSSRLLCSGDSVELISFAAGG